jgi:hypothetical protein
MTTFLALGLDGALRRHAIRQQRAIPRLTLLSALCERRRRVLAAVPSHSADARRWQADLAYFEAKAAVWAAISLGQAEDAWAGLANLRTAQRALASSLRRVRSA